MQSHLIQYCSELWAILFGSVYRPSLSIEQRIEPSDSAVKVAYISTITIGIV